ncbi:MAG: ABC transporter ATP-binding protein [Lachnospiraceae bacterium]|nr:ABC transporter ATP-binding protein [Lachnospiraceae bacterium]
MLEVQNLTKKYGDVAAIDKLTFNIEAGRIYGFLGPNGAGKSTTMNIITGYLAPTDGSVRIDGVDILKEPVKAKTKIGYLPEIPPVYPDMTVSEYLDFAAELKKLHKPQRLTETERVMEQTHISDVRNRLIKNLSKGYKQRVGLAQALIGEPPLIILDEPTVGLDPLQIIEIRQLISELKEKHTVILSSHILQEISAVCDHIMIISKGRLVASDTPENLARSVSTEVSTNLQLRGGEQEIRESLKDVGGISSIEVTASDEEGILSVELKAKEGDIREEVFKALAASGIPVLEMHTTRQTLEDIYLRLTGDNADIADTDTGKADETAAGEADDANTDISEEVKE